MPDLTLDVVVTNYETWPLTARCVERILDCRGRPEAILIVDDHSSTPPPGLPPSVSIQRNPENLGLVRSLNLGIRSLASDVIVLFDSDAYPVGEFADPVRRRFQEDPRLGILGFATVDEDGRPTESHVEEPDVESLVLGQRLHALWLRLFRRRRQRARNVYTCAMAIRRQAFEELGGFDEGFDWLDLDHDLCMRARRAGWRIEHAEEIVAFHRGSGAPQKASQRVLRFYKNRWLLLRKFDKIQHPRMVRALVLSRLRAECAVLRFLGLLSPRSAALRDKLEGRRAVIRHCLQHYR